eukprot:10687134-Ditylum_brightwellii.AAC.1
MPIDAAAQDAADAGNFKGALNFLTCNTPPALYNDSLFQEVPSLYPQTRANDSSPEVAMDKEEHNIISKLQSYPQN